MARSVAFRNADDLFAQLSVRDVDQVLARTTRDADAKRDELKTLVSSRYHDLIDSADAIVGMTATVANFQDLVRDVESRAQRVLRDRPSLINVSALSSSTENNNEASTDRSMKSIQSRSSSPARTGNASDVNAIADDDSALQTTVAAFASADSSGSSLSRDGKLRQDADHVNALMLLPTHVWTSMDAHYLWHAAFLFHVALALTRAVKTRDESVSKNITPAETTDNNGIDDDDNDDDAGLFSWFGVPADSSAQLTELRQAARRAVTLRSSSCVQIIQPSSDSDAVINTTTTTTTPASSSSSQTQSESQVNLWHRFPLVRSQCQLVRDMRSKVTDKARVALSDGSLSLLSCAGATAAFVSLLEEEGNEPTQIRAVRELLKQRVNLLKAVLGRLSSRQGPQINGDAAAKSHRVAVLCTALRCVQQMVQHVMACFGQIFTAPQRESLLAHMLELTLRDAVQQLDVPTSGVRDVAVLVGPYQDRKLRDIGGGGSSGNGGCAGLTGCAETELVSLVQECIRESIAPCMNEAIESVLQSVTSVKELVELRTCLVTCEQEGQQAAIHQLIHACGIVEGCEHGANQVTSALHTFDDLCTKAFSSESVEHTNEFGLNKRKKKTAQVLKHPVVFGAVFQTAVVTRMSSMLRDTFKQVCMDTKKAVLSLTQDPDAETCLKSLVIKVKREQTVTGGGGRWSGGGDGQVQDMATVEDLAAAHLDSILPLYPAEDGTLSALDLVVHLDAQLQAVYASALAFGADDSLSSIDTKNNCDADDDSDDSFLAEMVRHGDVAVVDALHESCLDAFEDLVEWVCDHTQTKTTNFKSCNNKNQTEERVENDSGGGVVVSRYNKNNNPAAADMTVMAVVEMLFRKQLELEQALLAARVCQALSACDVIDVVMMKNSNGARESARSMTLTKLRDRLCTTASGVYDGWVAHVVNEAAEQVTEEVRSEQWDLGEQMWNELHAGSCRLVRVSDKDDDDDNDDDGGEVDSDACLGDDDNDLIMVPCVISHHVLAFVHKLCQAVRCVGDAQFTIRVRLAIDDRKAAAKVGNDSFAPAVGSDMHETGESSDDVIKGGSGQGMMDMQAEARTTAACLDCFGGFSQRASQRLADRALRAYTDAIATVLGVRLGLEHQPMPEDGVEEELEEEDANDTNDVSHVSQPAALRALLDLMWIQMQLAPAATSETVGRVEKTVMTVVDDVIEPLWCLYRPALDLALVECLEGTHLLAGPLLLLHQPGQATSAQQLLKAANERTQQRARGSEAATAGPVWVSREGKGQSGNNRHVTLMPLAAPIPRIGLLPVATPFKLQSQQQRSLNPLASASGGDRRNVNGVRDVGGGVNNNTSVKLGAGGSTTASAPAAGSVSDKAFAAMGGLGTGLSHWLQG